jgi:DNA-binding Xre family transcriptional regulator
VKIDKEKIKVIMADKGITPKIVAERMGISPVRLSILWCGKQESQPKTVHKIADALRVHPKEILV